MNRKSADDEKKSAKICPPGADSCLKSSDGVTLPCISGKDYEFGTVENHAKDDGTEAVRLLCSFYRDTLQSVLTFVFYNL